MSPPLPACLNGAFRSAPEISPGNRPEPSRAAPVSITSLSGTCRPCAGCIEVKRASSHSSAPLPTQDHPHLAYHRPPASTPISPTNHHVISGCLSHPRCVRFIPLFGFVLRGSIVRITTCLRHSLPLASLRIEAYHLQRCAYSAEGRE